MSNEQTITRNQINISEIRNAVSRNVENTAFDLEINHPQYGWIPYTLNPWDTDQTINNDQLLDLIGLNYENYVPPTQEELDQKAARLVREKRLGILSMEVDPIVSNPLRWADMTTEQQNAWSQYRTDLLNITEQEGFPHDIMWPSPPE